MQIQRRVRGARWDVGPCTRRLVLVQCVSMPLYQKRNNKLVTVVCVKGGPWRMYLRDGCFLLVDRSARDDVTFGQNNATSGPRHAWPPHTLRPYASGAPYLRCRALTRHWPSTPRVRSVTISKRTKDSAPDAVIGGDSARARRRYRCDRPRQ
jgi:hypothetical protein